VDRDSRASRASSFDSIADLYERVRPGYPDEVVRWLVGDAPLDVLDLAAGTGKLTRKLVALGHRVVAVDPSREMLARLAEALPRVRVLEGTAERIPLADGSVDAVTVAQAFHWFDPPQALAEIARVLRHGGMLGVVWNTRDERVPWVAELSAVIGAEHDPGLGRAIGEHARFGPAEKIVATWSQRLDRDGLIGLIRSRSYCAVRPLEEQEPVLARVGAVYEAHAGADGIELPYLTTAYRARRSFS
jgi:ubiquinone/menaquinone biosynthesis C-methylase UbiE